MTWLKQNLAFVISLLLGMLFLSALVSQASPSVDVELWKRAIVPFVVVALVLAVFALVVPWRVRQKKRADAAKFAAFKEDQDDDQKLN